MSTNYSAYFHKLSKTAYENNLTLFYLCYRKNLYRSTYTTSAYAICASL